MKTAIVKTTFWEEESFAEMNIDTKLVYFYLLTNPKREIVNVMRINRKVMSAHSGLTVEQINVCLNQLVAQNYIVMFESYISLVKDHVQAKSGRFTQAAIYRELSTIPQVVKDALSEFVSGTVPEHKDKDKDKVIQLPVDNYVYDDGKAKEFFESVKRKEYFSDEDTEKLTSGSGESQEYNNKDNNIITKPVDNFESGDRFSNRDIVWEFSDDEKNEVNFK